MTSANDYYLSVGRSFKEAEESQMFGKPCFKTGGKAFVSFFQDHMVFKLDKDARLKALKLEGAVLFDPSGKGRPMKEWVQVPYMHRGRWQELAAAALHYVGGV